MIGRFISLKRKITDNRLALKDKIRSIAKA